LHAYAYAKHVKEAHRDTPTRAHACACECLFRDIARHALKEAERLRGQYSAYTDTPTRAHVYAYKCLFRYTKTRALKEAEGYIYMYREREREHARARE
jgi:hypothetical protein